MYKRIINRKTRVERMARLLDDIIGEAQNEPKNITPEKIDSTVRILALDDLDRIAQGIETIAERLR